MGVEQGADKASIAEQASHRIRQEKCLSVLGAFKQFILPKNTERQDKLECVTTGLQEPNSVFPLGAMAQCLLTVCSR